MFAPGGASDAVRFALSDVLRFCRKVMGCVPRLTPAGTSRPQDTSRAFRSSRSAPAEHIVHKITVVRSTTVILWSGRRDSNSLPPPWQGGALPNELRPRWCLRPESDRRHADFQSAALPTELPRHMATRNGLEPSTSSVTGWRSKPTELPGHIGGNNRARTCDPMLVRHVLSQLSYAPGKAIKQAQFQAAN